MGSPALSLYVHYPWCVKKCPYCDFNSHESGQRDDDEQAGYIAALLDDLLRDVTFFDLAARPVTTIFIGGGTPSLMTPDSLHTLMEGIAARVSLAEDAEITMEANPGTTDYHRFQAYRQAGINRLSIGVQSFSGTQLERLGRIHTANEVTEAFWAARDAGFENINLDLMHGLPNQNPEAAIADLDAAIALGPEHISWYQLTIEPNTVFYKRPPALPDDDVLWDIYEKGLTRLGAAGFERYEVSAFAQPDRQAQHNLNYWRFGDYIGVGAGAHGKLTNSNGEVVRTSKSRLPADYLKAQKRQQRVVASEELPLEFMMNTLRLTSGFPKSLVASQTGLKEPELVQIDRFYKEAAKRNLLDIEQDWVRPTDQGIQFLNDLLMMVDDSPRS